jgi:putative two-component system response regulator
MNNKILLVEDDSELNASIRHLLEKHGFTCHSYEEPTPAIDAIAGDNYDLLITDLKLPHFDGITLARKALAVRPDLRTLIITAYTSMPSVIDALRLGVDNYILKPFSSEELIFQVERALERRRLTLQNQQYQQNLTQLVEERTAQLVERQRELSTSQMENIFAIGNIIEARDVYTRGHTERVTLYAVMLAQTLGWDDQRIHDLGIGSPLHDIGKIGVPDSILKKNGPLTFEEYEMMKDHPTLGYELVRGTDLPIGTTACILYHHERYDGKGYPFRLGGEDIPVEGRVMAICDAFDAMTSSRVYRKAMDIPKATAIVKENAGTQFDPHLADAFCELVAQGRINAFLFEADLSQQFEELLSELTRI